MIWLSWRQFRVSAATAVAALTAFFIVLVITESHMASLYATSGITGCHGGSCAGLASQFLVRLTSGRGVPLLPVGTNPYVILYFLSILAILVAPAIIGIFWGAPLIARELETGTGRLAWNQSITRTRWLAVKLTLTGVTAMAVTEGFSLVQAWWAAPIGRAVGLGGSASILTEGRYGPFVFPSHGITPMGYAAFGFALGVTAGFLVRRAIPAMAVTLAVFAVVQFATPLWVRPNLLPAGQTIATIEATQANIDAAGRSVLALAATTVPGQPGAWITSSGAVAVGGTAAGGGGGAGGVGGGGGGAAAVWRPVSGVPAACRPAVPNEVIAGGSPALDDCLTSHGIRVAVSYQPVSRYWALQFAETGLFLVLALGLAWYCFWRLNRRLSL